MTVQSFLVTGDTVAGASHGDEGEASGEHQAGAQATAQVSVVAAYETGLVTPGAGVCRGRRGD